MSRIDGKIEGVGAVPAETADILAALVKEAKGSVSGRQEAVSRYLSASDGWQKASAELGGAFAAPGDELNSAKDE